MKTDQDQYDTFAKRHIGPSEDELGDMLDVVGVKSLDELIDEVVPAEIRMDKPLEIPKRESEFELLEDLKQTASKNKVFKSYIGLGYYDCITPGVIQRNILENPGWYTQYTPYQSEIAQGRLEALLNFQTMVADLTKMEVANASLLDEGTAAAEAMTMLHRVGDRKRKGDGPSVFFVSDKCFPQTIDILRTRAEPLGIELTVGDYSEFEFGKDYFGALLQYPDTDGDISDYSDFVNKAHESGIMVAVAADLLSLTLLKPPGEFGADVVVGSTQRFGVSLGFGGPHAAYFATHEKFARQVPGRIIGVSVDSQGNPAYRMALQTREQHIRRERATSNICTAQALLAIMASMYAVYHGPRGLKEIASRINSLAGRLAEGLDRLGIARKNEFFFDTITIDTGDDSGKILDQIRANAEKSELNFRYIDNRHISVSLDETTVPEDVEKIISVFDGSVGEGAEKSKPFDVKNYSGTGIPSELVRTSRFLTHPVFNIYHSETKMLRYIKKLEQRDLSLTVSMIPLGSCTMKLNATSEMIPVTWPEFARIHPFAPAAQTTGYLELFSELEDYLGRITGLPAVSLQPNSGAQGEYTGLMVIRAYYEDQGQSHRNIALIPSSAHGTNPASAVMAGMKVVVVDCDEMGNIDLKDLKKKAVENRDKLAVLMVTYPSTHGVFEEEIKEICSIVHENGGQIYMDGANMNAQVGVTSPAIIGADVCHLNLHKTFSIPHGGGGPGMGPICAREHLAPFLPGHIFADTGGGKPIPAVSSAPWGSSSILVISYAYIKMLGKQGVTEATKYAILNANYIKSRLEEYYDVLYTGESGRVAHEFILDLRRFKREAGVEVDDVAKRLMDYGFHAPTVSWPVAGTMMIEPTESEDKGELDRFCDALISIYAEMTEIAGDNWNHPYTRKKAVFPLPFVEENKFWPPVARIDNPYGDRNLMCTCPDPESYQD